MAGWQGCPIESRRRFYGLGLDKVFEKILCEPLEDFFVSFDDLGFAEAEEIVIIGKTSVVLDF